MTLHLGVNDRPSIHAALGFGFQQAMVCMSGMLVYPLIVSEVVCAGSAAVQLRVQLIAATFVTCGIATLLQTTFGLRLSVLHGPATAFLPPLLAYQSQTIHCTYSAHDDVPEHEWKSRLKEIQGSLLVACVIFLLVGGTGLAGVLSRHIGPCTIVPLMLLLTTSIVPTVEAKLSLHWVSLLMFVCVVTMAVYMEKVHVRVPYYSPAKRSGMTMRVRLFGQFPYLLSMLLVWLVCHMLTILDLEPADGEARTDKNVSMIVLHQSPWFQVPLPGAFGFPQFHAGLCLAYVASCLASIIENIGSYDLLARTSQQRAPPPKNAVNRAIIVEGVGSMLAALMGVCTGVTTYAENIALIHITKVASRVTMQVAGVILVVLGVFTKFAAVLAAIPDALIGGVLLMGVSMIAGVALSNLQLVDLRITRNLSVMGLSLLLGLVVPMRFERQPLNTGHVELDQTLNMLLGIRMLVGGVIATFLDNTVPGATREQRGFHTTLIDETQSEDSDEVGQCSSDSDGYALPSYINRVLRAFPSLRSLPFFPKPQQKSASAANFVA